MSEENGSMDPYVLVTIICIVAAFAGAVICAYRWSNKRTAMMQEFAQTRGWAFSRTDTEGLKAKADAFFPVVRFDPNCIMSVETGDRFIRFFDFYKNWRDRQRGGDFGSGCIIESPRFRNAGSGVEILSRTGIASAASAFVSDQVDMGDSEFSRNFIVLAKDRQTARRVITDSLQTALLAYQRKPVFIPLDIGINGAGAMVWTGMYDDPQQWTDLIELCREIEASMP